MGGIIIGMRNDSTVFPNTITMENSQNLITDSVRIGIVVFKSIQLRLLSWYYIKAKHLFCGCAFVSLEGRKSALRENKPIFVNK